MYCIGYLWCLWKFVSENLGHRLAIIMKSFALLPGCCHCWNKIRREIFGIESEVLESEVLEITSCWIREGQKLFYLLFISWFTGIFTNKYMDMYMEGHIYVPCLKAGLAALPALCHGYRTELSTLSYFNLLKTNPCTSVQPQHTTSIRACLNLLEQVCNLHAWDSQCSITV